jgi:hypothetical protein
VGYNPAKTPAQPAFLSSALFALHGEPGMKLWDRFLPSRNRSWDKNVGSKPKIIPDLVICFILKILQHTFTG